MIHRQSETQINIVPHSRESAGIATLRKPYEGQPRHERILDPPSSGTFYTPVGYHCSVVPAQKSNIEQTRIYRELAHRALVIVV